jgi:hypothetical protein
MRQIDRQAAQAHSVEQLEYGCIRTDAERQRHHSHHRERRDSATEAASRKLDLIPSNCVQNHKQSCI